MRRVIFHGDMTTSKSTENSPSGADAVPSSFEAKKRNLSILWNTVVIASIAAATTYGLFKDHGNGDALQPTQKRPQPPEHDPMPYGARIRLRMAQITDEHSIQMRMPYIQDVEPHTKEVPYTLWSDTDPNGTVDTVVREGDLNPLIRDKEDTLAMLLKAKKLGAGGEGTDQLIEETKRDLAKLRRLKEERQ